MIYKYPIYFDQGYKYLLKTRTDFGRKVFGIHQRVLIAEAQSRSRCQVKCNIIVVKRYMFLHQAYDNGSKSHWSFG